MALDTDDVTTLNVGLNDFPVGFVVLSRAEKLYLDRLLLQIDENQLVRGGTNIHDTTTDRDFITLDEHAFFLETFSILGTETIQANGLVKLVRVGVDVVVALSLQPVFTIFVVLGWVELFFFFFRFVSFLGSLLLLLCCLLSIGLTLLLAFFKLGLADHIASRLIQKELGLVLGLLLLSSLSLCLFWVCIIHHLIFSLG